jgi:phytoene dehydrogenase-like protein
VLLHHVFGEVNRKTGVWGHAIGGMGAITQAMATETPGRATGIEFEDGRVILGNHVTQAHRGNAYSLDT